MKVVAVLCVLYKCGLTSAPHLPGCPIECLVVVCGVASLWTDFSDLKL